MDFNAWLLFFVMWANVWASQGYRYDLKTPYFIAPDGTRAIITCCPAPRRR